LNERADFPIGLAGVREIVSNPIGLAKAMRRVEVEYIGTRSDEALVPLLAEHPRFLCVVNTRGHARRLFQRLAGQASGEPSDSLFHLSAQMCPAHRTMVLWRIRKRLDAKQACRVISTQLVEAGVDIDFPVVFRAMAGLDSITQAAGRCNREGGADRGRCFVFDEAKPSKAFAGAAADSRSVLFDSAAREAFAHDPLALDTIEHYFSEHFWRQKSHWDEKKVMPCFVGRGVKFNFQDAAERYRLIENEQTPVVIPFGRRGLAVVEAILDLDRDETFDAGSLARQQRWLQREAQRYTVGVYDGQLQQLLNSEAVAVVAGRFHVLYPGACRRCYRDDLGLITTDEEATEAGLWIV
jgi:CRISPR-associated endonuclease/helicase Cas3